MSEVNKNGVPFSVWTILHRNWGWVRDTTLRLGMSLILSCVKTHECHFRIECYDKKRASQCCTAVRLRCDQTILIRLLSMLTSPLLGPLDWREPFTPVSWESTSWIRMILAETCLAITGTCSDTWRLMTTGSTTGTGDPTLGLTGWWMQGIQNKKMVDVKIYRYLAILTIRGLLSQPTWSTLVGVISVWRTCIVWAPSRCGIPPTGEKIAG